MTPLTAEDKNTVLDILDDFLATETVTESIYSQFPELDLDLSDNEDTTDLSFSQALMGDESITPGNIFDKMETHPHIIRDMQIETLRNCIANLPLESKKRVMAFRKSMRNRVSAHKCARQKRRRMSSLEDECSRLRLRVLELESLLSNKST